ncbi:hypothetical protein QJS10_CPA02g00273 [Acorus calamus]|uniref:RRM domain-containing protein n=1 Tax=Acorus calamus TaxID=4465 RepID=A0AAV9FER7_ACOCL|nr:hypothetical protein QJS10_CPA02g00273 [Acorus calamus]
MDDMSAAAAGYYYPPQPPPAVLHNPHYPYYHQQPPPPPPPPAVEFHPPPPPGQLYHAHHHLTSYGIPPPYHPHNSDEVRTLFIAGLPEDVKSREIYSLFHEFPGYESCHLRSSGQSNQELTLMRFEVHNEQLNMIIARVSVRSCKVTNDSPYNSYDKKARGSAAFSKSHTDASDGSNFHLPGIGNSAYNMNAHPSAQSYGNFDSDAGNDAEPKTKMVLITFLGCEPNFPSIRIQGYSLFNCSPESSPGYDSVLVGRWGGHAFRVSFTKLTINYDMFKFMRD